MLASRFRLFARQLTTITFPGTYPFELSMRSRLGEHGSFLLEPPSSFSGIPNTGHMVGRGYMSDLDKENSIPFFLALNRAEDSNRLAGFSRRQFFICWRHSAAFSGLRLLHSLMVTAEYFSLNTSLATSVSSAHATSGSSK